MFRIRGLSPSLFAPLFDLADDELARRGAARVVADMPGLPCRVSLAYAPLGEELLLLHHEHQPSPRSPYRASGPIYVRRAAGDAFDRVDEVPEPIRMGLLSLRAYDERDFIVHGEVLEGAHFEAAIAPVLARADVAYAHLHYARRGCFAARVDRA